MRPLLLDPESSSNLITILPVTTTPILDPTRPKVNWVSVARISESRERAIETFRRNVSTLTPPHVPPATLEEDGTAG